MPTLVRSAPVALRRALSGVVAYGLLAGILTWPAIGGLGEVVPGSDRADLWDSLWSMWFVQQAVSDGAWPLHTTLLNHPSGGALLVTDLPAALFGLLSIPLLGLPAAYTALVLLRLTAAGLAAHGFARALLAERGLPSGAAFIAGVGYEAAPVLLSGVHNGTSEAFNGAPAALAAWACWSVARRGGGGRIALAGLALLFASLASWYSAVVAFVFAGSIALFGPRGQGLLRRVGPLALGLLLVAPFAFLVERSATAPGNLVGIKGARELSLVRRSTGPADPLVYVRGGDFRSPDFRKISRYGEDFLHCAYLGGVLILGAALVSRSARARQGTAPLWLGGALGLALSLGPVVVQGGAPLIFLGDRAFPLPYLLVERLPGFSSLSLLYRLGQAPALAAALLASLGWSSRLPRSAPVVVLGILAELRLLSPLQGLPDVSDAQVGPAIAALAQAPAGAVINFPVVGGRGYLFEQTVHGKPLAATLNFPNSLVGKRVWQAMLDRVDLPAARFQAEVARAARKEGIRYVVVHQDPSARPDMHDGAVAALRAARAPLARSGGIGEEGSIEVYALW